MDPPRLDQLLLLLLTLFLLDTDAPSSSPFVGLRLIRTIKDRDDPVRGRGIIGGAAEVDEGTDVNLWGKEE
eukprot:scaffold64915_cov45-Attheya_sp.AAC.6